MNSSRDGGDHDRGLAGLAAVTGTSAVGTVLDIEALPVTGGQYHRDAQPGNQDLTKEWAQ
jgi:hypothetical protein